MDLTILIPTKDRPDFLARALEYYKQMKFDGYIIIGDSSEDGCWQKNEALVRSMKSLDIVYHTYTNPPYLHDGMCVKQMNKHIPTKYAIFHGDDDLLIPSALQECIDFLEESPDFTAVRGKRLNIRIAYNKPYGVLNRLYEFASQQNDMDSDNPISRWEEYMRMSISSQYWVHRTEIWKKMYEKADLMPARYLGPEFLPCSLSAILGKSKQLECVLLIYQVHESIVFDFNKCNLFDLINTDGWAMSMRILKQTLIENGIPPYVVYSGLWFHLVYFLTVQYKRRYEDENLDTGTSAHDDINKDIVKINSDWPYYKVFLPIFNFLTKEKKNEST